MALYTVGVSAVTVLLLVQTFTIHRLELLEVTG